MTVRRGVGPGRRQPGEAAPVALERVAVSPARYRWSARTLKLLGKMSDTRLAKRLRISKSAVVDERLRRGIAAFERHREPFRWNARALALLGTDSDRKVAAELGIGHPSVYARRRLLGIPPAFARPHEKGVRPWTGKEERLLGTLSDEALARRLRRNRSDVYMRRRELDIPASRPIRRARWTKRLLARLGKDSDGAIAAELGVTEAIAARKRIQTGIPAIFDRRALVLTRKLARLLREPKSIIMRKTALSTATVHNLRRKLGIPNPKSVFERPWTPVADRKLGKIPDAELASELGLAAISVRRRRIRAGIPSSVAWRRRDRAVEDQLLLSDLPIPEIAARLGCGVERARSRAALLRKSGGELARRPPSR